MKIKGFSVTEVIAVVIVLFLVLTGSVKLAIEARNEWHKGNVATVTNATHTRLVGLEQRVALLEAQMRVHGQVLEENK